MSDPNLARTELPARTSPISTGPLTIAMIIAYLQSRGWIVEPHAQYYGGYMAYMPVMQDGELRKAGNTIYAVFVEQIAGDARRAFGEAERLNHHA